MRDRRLLVVLLVTYGLGQLVGVLLGMLLAGLLA